LVVYDLLGSVVREIVNEDLNAGMYTYKWMGENQNGGRVSAGMYFYQIQAGSFNKTRKMILLK
jgi:flagellar hook assembly protein FlgD